MKLDYKYGLIERMHLHCYSIDMLNVVKKGFSMLKPGLYEQIISQSLSKELASISDTCKHVEKLDAAEAPQALAGMWQKRCARR